MTFLRPVPLRRQRLAHPAGGGATFTGRLAAMTERGDVVVNRAQIRIAVIVARADVVDTIRAAATAQMADPPMITKDPLPLRVPRRG